MQNTDFNRQYFIDLHSLFPKNNVDETSKEARPNFAPSYQLKFQSGFHLESHFEIIENFFQINFLVMEHLLISKQLR
jgi:hypothetical protein